MQVFSNFIIHITILYFLSIRYARKYFSYTHLYYIFSDEDILLLNNNETYFKFSQQAIFLMNQNKTPRLPLQEPSSRKKGKLSKKLRWWISEFLSSHKPRSTKKIPVLFHRDVRRYRHNSLEFSCMKNSKSFLKR